MAAENRPTYNLKTNITQTAPKEISLEKGTIGFGSWETQTEYKDIKITSNGKEISVKSRNSVSYAPYYDYATLKEWATSVLEED